MPIYRNDDFILFDANRNLILFTCIVPFFVMF